MRLVVAVVVWIAAIAGAAELSTVVAHQVANERAAGSLDASAVKGNDPVSLFRTANLRKALATVRRHVGANPVLDNFVIYPGYVDLTLVKGGSETDVYVNAAGTYDITDTGGDPGDTPLFNLAHVKVGVPTALSARIATATHIPQAQLGYMIAEIDPATHHFQWLVYPVKGTGVEYFQTSGATGRLFEYRTNSSTGLQRVRG